MVLKLDCMRAVLLAVEASGIDERLIFSRMCEKLPDYSEEDVWYTCLKLEEAGFLSLETSNMSQQPLPPINRVKYLTYQGHEFLAKIKDEKQWGILKKCLKAIRNYSLDAIKAASEGFATAGISAFVQTFLTENG